MANNDKVQCKCCGMMMVPKTIFSPGIYGGWGWRIGGGRPVSSCCPFCLSENWDDRSRPVEKSVAEKSYLLLKVVAGAFLGYSLFSLIGKDALGVGYDRTFEMVAQWAFILIAIAVYRRYKMNKQ